MMSSEKVPTILVSWSEERPENAPEDYEDAAKQHNEFSSSLISAGANLVRVPIVPHAFDSVFIKDSAVVVDRPDGRRAFMANFRKPQRQAEQLKRSLALQELGFRIEGGAISHFEGGDLEVLADKSLAFMGYGIRTDLAAKEEVERFLGIEVVPLELTEKKFFHLDLAFSVLSDGTAFACRAALSDQSWKTLMSINRFKTLIPVSSEEASQFAVNWVEVGDNVVLGEFVPSVQRRLEAAGKNVIVTNLTSFHKSNGGAACLSAQVLPLPARFLSPPV